MNAKPQPALILMAALALPAAAAATIEGPTWRLTELRGYESARLPAGSQSVTAQFDRGRISCFSGCNHYFGSYTLRQERLVIGSLAGSMMACDPAAMALEGAVLRALAGTFRAVSTETSLSLRSEAGESILVFAKQPAPTLTGFSTTITGFNNGRQAVVSPLAGTTMYLAFKDGTVKGFAGCNSFRATYEVDGERITVGPVATTRRQCPGAGVMEQEKQFLAALRSTTTWTFSGAMLDMHRKDGERTIVGTREAGS